MSTITKTLIIRPSSAIVADKSQMFDSLATIVSDGQRIAEEEGATVKKTNVVYHGYTRRAEIRAAFASAAEVDRISKAIHQAALYTFSCSIEVA